MATKVCIPVLTGRTASRYHNVVFLFETLLWHLYSQFSYCDTFRYFIFWQKEGKTFWSQLNNFIHKKA
jgi:hypothetical protein